MQVRVGGQVREGKLRYRYWTSTHPWAIGSGGCPRIEVSKYSLKTCGLSRRVW